MACFLYLSFSCCLYGRSRKVCHIFTERFWELIQTTGNVATLKYGWPILRTTCLTMLTSQLPDRKYGHSSFAPLGGYRYQASLKLSAASYTERHGRYLSSLHMAFYILAPSHCRWRVMKPLCAPNDGYLLITSVTRQLCSRIFQTAIDTSQIGLLLKLSPPTPLRPLAHHDFSRHRPFSILEGWI